MATPKLNLMIILLFISLFTGGVVGEKRNSNYHNLDNDLMLIDNFRFTGTQGRVELKVNKISFSNFNYSNNPLPNPIPPQNIHNNSFSNMTFFLSDKFLLLDINQSCLINNSHSKYKLYTLDGANSSDIIFKGIDKPGDYILYFQNCAGKNEDDVHVSMNVQSSMYNIRGEDCTRDYLSPTKALVTKVFYPFFALVHFYLALVFGSHIHRSKTPKKTMFWLMVFVPYLRCWKLILGMLHNIYIMKGGCADCWPSLLLSSASGFLGEAPVAILLVLFSTGFLTVKLSLHLGDKIFILLEIFGQLLVVFLNIQLQFCWRQILYLYPGIMTTFFSLAVGLMLHQWTVKFSLRFLRDVARGNCAKASCANQTPMSLLVFAEILKSLFSTYTSYSIFQCFVIAPLEIFSSHLPLIATLKELAAMIFYLQVSCHMRTELWTLTISKMDSKDNDISKYTVLRTHFNIKKAEPLIPYDDDLIYSYLEKEWDGV